MREPHLDRQCQPETSRRTKKGSVIATVRCPHVRSHTSVHLPYTCRTPPYRDRPAVHLLYTAVQRQTCRTPAVHCRTPRRTPTVHLLYTVNPWTTDRPAVHLLYTDNRSRRRTPAVQFYSFLLFWCSCAGLRLAVGGWMELAQAHHSIHCHQQAPPPQHPTEQPGRLLAAPAPSVHRLAETRGTPVG